MKLKYNKEFVSETFKKAKEATLAKITKKRAIAVVIVTVLGAFSVSVPGGVEAVTAAYDMGADAFVGVGSQAEYGLVDKGPIGPETPAYPITPYGICKHAAGKLTLYRRERLGIRTIWARVFSVYGKYDKPTSMISQTFQKMMDGVATEFTAGTQLWDYLYSKDSGEAFRLIGEKGKDQRVYCVGSGKCKPISEYLKIIQSILEPKYPLGLGILPYKAKSVMNLCADISILVEDTGFEPKICFHKGIQYIYQFLKNKKPE